MHMEEAENPESRQSFNLSPLYMKKRILMLAFAAVALLLASCDPDLNKGGDYPAELDKMVVDASLVVKGKVVVLHTSLTDEEDVDNHGVVEVTEVVDGPETLRDLKGQQITVRFADIGKVKEGEERLIFAEPYWFGEFIGVDEKASVGSGDKLYADQEIKKHIQSARKKVEEDATAKRLKAATLVVTGKVSQINPAKLETRVVTEHDPEWMEAEIQIEETLNGKADGGSVKILFASSNDVMYYLAPKFKQGDEGIFLLENTDEKLRKVSGAALMIKEPTGFVRGKEQVALYKRLLK